MKCRVCGSEAEWNHNAVILGKYQISYSRCNNCEYLQTEQPYWLDEAYSESINVSDTGLVARNISLANISTIIFGLFFEKNGKYLDFAGGYGLYARLMRDVGFDFYWSDRYSKNLLARGFEAHSGLDEYEAVTAFEAFEHFVDPVSELRQMGELSDTVLFSTELYGSSVPGPHEWAYYGLGHGQHIGFFSLRTLEYIAKVEGYNLWSNGRSLHLLSRRPLPGLLISIALKARRVGLSSFMRLFLKSRTLTDWDLLR